MTKQIVILYFAFLLLNARYDIKSVKQMDKN